MQQEAQQQRGVSVDVRSEIAFLCTFVENSDEVLFHHAFLFSGVLPEGFGIVFLDFVSHPLVRVHGLLLADHVEQGLHGTHQIVGIRELLELALCLVDVVADDRSDKVFLLRIELVERLLRNAQLAAMSSMDTSLTPFLENRLSAAARIFSFVISAIIAKPDLTCKSHTIMPNMQGKSKNNIHQLINEYYKILNINNLKR